MVFLWFSYDFPIKPPLFIGFQPSQIGGAGFRWPISSTIHDPSGRAWCGAPGTLRPPRGRRDLGGATGQSSYPLVNLQKTMENHNFQWENPLFQWPFSIAMLNYQRVCIHMSD